MPVIFTRPPKGGRGGVSGQLGLPTDGTYLDGLLPFDGSTLTADAVDAINEVLTNLAPDPPDSLAGTNLVGNRTMYTGKLPSGLSNSWYQDGESAGDTISRVIIQDSIILSSANPSTRFRNGNEGTLVASHREGAGGLATVAILDIESNFDDSVLGPNLQDLSTWDTQGIGDPCTDAVVNFTNGKGNLEVTRCGWHNDFDAWQRMNARFNVSNLDEGYNSFRMTHSIPPDESTNIYKLWYDDDTNALSFSTLPSISEGVISSNKYLSGVKYYSLGDTFIVSYVGEHVYKKCYHVSNVSKYTFDGSSEQTVNPVGVPSVSGSISASGTVTIDQPNYYSLDARLTASLYHPWKSTVSQSSPSANMLVWTYGNVSTDLIEYFRDENYRLPNGSYDSVPGSITGVWDSTQTLSNGEALVYNNKSQYPNVDFTSTLPAGNPDYTLGFSGDQHYFRAFYDSNAHSNVTFDMNGLSHLSASGTGNLNLHIKLPSQTGWLDAGVPYNAAIFTGIDGDGCQVSKTSSSITLTFGTFSTAFSGYMVILRATFRNTSVNDYSYVEVTNW